MKIAIIGYGKMGKAIEKLAVDRGHEISLKVGRDGFTEEDLDGSDVAIEVSVPDAAAENISTCLRAGIPVVVGTTAWYDNYDDIAELSTAYGTPLLCATNFSVGVNIFFEINRRLAELMNPQGEYDVSMEEVHHLQKLDAPSGTAISIADDILKRVDRKNEWVCQEGDNRTETGPLDLNIEAKREEGVPGTHVVKYSSEIDTIEISHTAHNRQGFALGAVLAAEWIPGKRGIHSMKDVLAIKN